MYLPAAGSFGMRGLETSLGPEVLRDRPSYHLSTGAHEPGSAAIYRSGMGQSRPCIKLNTCVSTCRLKLPNAILPQMVTGTDAF